MDFIKNKEWKTYQAIEVISQAIIKDGLCKAIILKGSIGRGDDDCYSDVDMYVVVEKSQYENFLEKRLTYLKTYKTIVFSEENDFGVLQMLAIYEDTLHFDLYTVTIDMLTHYDKIKVYYDKDHLFDSYKAQPQIITKEKLSQLFSNILYGFVEASSAYARKNYAWTARIMDQSIAETSILLRYLYDKELAYLGLKKLNEIIPKEQYLLIEQAYQNLNKDGFQTANKLILAILEFIISNIEEEIKKEFNFKFYNWVKANINVNLFAKPRDF